MKPRGLFVTKTGETALDAVTEEEAPFVIRALASLLDPRVPLVRPGQDVSITHGSAIIGRPVPGTSLTICYVPLGEVFFLINLHRE